MDPTATLQLGANIESLIQLLNDPENKISILSGLPKCINGNEKLLKMLAMVEQDPGKWKVTQSDSLELVHILDAHPDLYRNSALIEYILSSLDLNGSFAKTLMANLILSGNFETYYNIMRKFDLPNDDRFFSVVRDYYWNYLDTINEEKGRPNGYIVYTSGENSSFSLGNPLGTTKRQRVSFSCSSGSNHFRVYNIAIGPFTTVFLGTFDANEKSGFYVSGKFGDQHYMLPCFVETKERIEFASLGHNHMILCSNKIYYYIGANARNQLGCGQSNEFIGALKHRPITDLLKEDGNAFLGCATSNNHSVLVTRQGVLVSGTNMGQMGPYASRAFCQRLGPPKSFTRLLGPGDSFAKSEFLKVAVADDITVVFVGLRIKVFFEYKEYKTVVSSENIVDIAICKPFQMGQTILLIWTSNFEIIFWTKTLKPSIRLSPQWKFLPDYDVLGDVSLNSGLSCSLEGDFYFVYKNIPYAGSVIGSVNNYSCQVERLKDAPGFVSKVFVSSSDKNMAFLTLNFVAFDKFREYRMSRNKSIFLRRMNIFHILQQTPADDCAEPYVVIEGKKCKFKVHLHIVRARAPSLLKLMDKRRRIDMRVYQRETIEDLLEFIYTGHCHLFALARWMFFQDTDSDDCVLCGNKFVKECESSSSKFCCKAYIILHEPAGDRFFDVDVWEMHLNRLMTLAREINYKEFEELCFSMIEAVSKFEFYYERIKNEIMLKRSFLSKSVTLDNIFPDEESTVCIKCSDGVLKFSRVILCSSIPYFEALYRWKNENEKCSTVELPDANLELASTFLKFLIVHSLDQSFQLTLDQLVKLFVFADKYGVVDLMESIIDVLQKEHLHVDELPVLCQLASSVFTPHLDSVISELVFVHLPFLFDTTVIENLPERIYKLLGEKLADTFVANKFSQISHMTSSNNPTTQIPLEFCDHKKNDENCKKCSETSRIGKNLLKTFINLSEQILEAFPEDIAPARLVQRLNQKRGYKKERRKKCISLSESHSRDERLQSRLSESNDFSRSILLGPENVFDQPRSSKDSMLEENGGFEERQADRFIGQCHETNDCFPLLTGHSSHSWVTNVALLPENQKHQISLDEIMREERETEERDLKERKLRLKNVVTTIPPVEERKRTRSIGQAWDSDLPRIPPVSLQNIQKDTLRDEALANKVERCKPVNLLEIEELAIEELTNYYNELWNEDCMIRVRRVPKMGQIENQRNPKWKIKTKNIE